jgi:site-specific DNA-cytosine methylase
VGQPEERGINLNSILESGHVDREKSLCILESENRLHIASESLYKRYKMKALGQIVFFSKDLNPDKGVRMLTQIELERLQTLPVGYTQPLKRNEAAGLIGNAWTVDVIAHIFKNMERGKNLEEEHFCKQDEVVR